MNKQQLLTKLREIVVDMKEEYPYIAISFYSKPESEMGYEPTVVWIYPLVDGQFRVTYHPENGHFGDGYFDVIAPSLRQVVAVVPFDTIYNLYAMVNDEHEDHEI